MKKSFLYNFVASISKIALLSGGKSQNVQWKVKAVKLFFHHLAIKAPPFGRLALIRPWKTISKNVVIIGLYFVKLCKTVWPQWAGNCFYIWGVFWNITIFLLTLWLECPQMLCAKFVANRWNRLGRVWNSRFARFCEFAKTVCRNGSSRRPPS